MSGPARGATAHPADCTCPRCAGFQPGNEWAAKPGEARGLVHGAQSSVALLLPEAHPLADELEPLVPAFAPSDRPLVLLAAVALRRIERAEAYIAAAEGAEEVERAERLTRDLGSWVTRAGRLLDQLGMSPTARARLGLDLARSSSTLAEYVAHAYPEREAVLDAAAVEELPTSAVEHDADQAVEPEHEHDADAVEEGGS